MYHRAQRGEKKESVDREEEELDLWITERSEGREKKNAQWKTHPSHEVAIPQKRFPRFKKPAKQARIRKQKFPRFPGFPSAARGEKKRRQGEEELDLWITERSEGK